MGWKGFSGKLKLAIVLAICAFLLTEIYWQFLSPLNWNHYIEIVDIISLRTFYYFLFERINIFLFERINIPYLSNLVYYLFPSLFWFFSGLLIEKVYSLAKNKSYWVRGGAAGLGVVISIALAGLLYSFACSGWFCGYSGLALLIYSLTFIPLGALIGWTYGKIKSK